MVSRAKLHAKLDTLEHELKELLIPHLKRAVNGENDFIFCVTNFNPFPQLKAKTDKQTEELVDMGAHIIALKNKLGASSDGMIAERLCWYCREWGNISNHHRKSAQGLAKQFLEEIENGQ